MDKQMKRKPADTSGAKLLIAALSAATIVGGWFGLSMGQTVATATTTTSTTAQAVAQVSTDTTTDTTATSSANSTQTAQAAQVTAVTQAQNVPVAVSQSSR